MNSHYFGDSSTDQDHSNAVSNGEIRTLEVAERFWPLRVKRLTLRKHFLYKGTKYSLRAIQRRIVRQNPFAG